MQRLTPPNYVIRALTALTKAGYSAYMVGGCVRDSLMGRCVRDWDVCTNALPDEVLAVFPGAITTGKRHGTITVVTREGQIEITTFRAEGAYSDHRRPDRVEFITELDGDLSRRDFTINAMAQSMDGELFDPFSGRADIDGRIIRCVGSPTERFGEDALRMLRALRFSAELGFRLDGALTEALSLCAPLAKSLAPERVSGELEKILMSDNPEILSEVLRHGLLDGYITAPRAHTKLGTLREIPKDRRLRWAAFCALLSGAGVIKDAEDFLISLRLDGKTVRYCGAGAALAREGVPTARREIKSLLAVHGEDVVRCACAACDATAPGERLRELGKLLDSGECWSLKRLSVTGDDLMALGYEGRRIGQLLETLLRHVIERPETNEKELLLGLLPAGEETS